MAIHDVDGLLKAKKRIFKKEKQSKFSFRIWSKLIPVKKPQDSFLQNIQLQATHSAKQDDDSARLWL